MSSGITISVISGVVLLILLLRVIFSSVQKNLEELIQERFVKQEMLLSTTRANCFGVKSKGGKQIRGNGALVLTKEILYFVRAVPRKEYIIPIRIISEVTMPKSFNGKSIFSPLLCIRYSLDNKEDEIAWAVSNL